MSDARNSEPGALEESYLGAIERLGVLWQNTQNPVYVWQAISLCYMVTIARQRDLSGKWPAFSAVVPHPFPSWCLEYLRIVAARIGWLADGIDFRGAVRPFGDAVSASQGEPEATLAPGDAAKLLPAALGITNSGRNEFANARALSAKGLDDLSFLHFTETDGQTRKQALDRIADENEDADVRNVERRIAAYRRAHQTTKPTR